MIFNFENFKKNEFVVNCETQKEFNSLCDYLEKRGLRFAHDIKENAWNTFKSETCVICKYFSLSLGYDSTSFFKKRAFPIYKYSQFIWDEHKMLIEHSKMENLLKSMGVDESMWKYEI